MDSKGLLIGWRNLSRVMISVSIGVRTYPGVYGYGLRLHLVNDDICLVV